jgi:hypothetical protein
MTKKRHDAEIRIYLYRITDDEAISLRDKIKDTIMDTKDSEGKFIKSAVVSFAKKRE